MSDPTVPPVPPVPPSLPSLPPEPAPGPAATPPTPSPSAAQSAGAAAEPAPASPVAAGTGLPPNVAAGLACLLSIIGGILFLVLEKKDQFVRFYAMQSTILGGLWLIVAIVFGVVLTILGSVPVISWLLVLLAKLVYLAFVVVTLITALKAFTDKEWEIPYLGKIARQQLAKMPTAP